WCGTPLLTRGMVDSLLGLQQPVHAPEVGGAHQRGLAELVLPLARLLSQNVPLVRAAPLELAAAGAGEALHGGAFGFLLRHCVLLAAISARLPSSCSCPPAAHRIRSSRCRRGSRRPDRAPPSPDRSAPSAGRETSSSPCTCCLPSGTRACDAS